MQLNKYIYMQSCRPLPISNEGRVARLEPTIYHTGGKHTNHCIIYVGLIELLCVYKEFDLPLTYRAKL